MYTGRDTCARIRVTLVHWKTCVREDNYKNTLKSIMSKKLDPFLQENIFIKSLEFGIRNMHSGTTFNDFYQFLKTMQPNIQNDFKHYMHVWFYENFYVNVIYDQVKDLRFTSSTFQSTNLEKFDSELAIITADAYQKYVDYQELKVAYQSSKEASKYAIIAICVTALVGLIQIAITLFQNSDNIKPH